MAMAIQEIQEFKAMKERQELLSHALKEYGLQREDDLKLVQHLNGRVSYLTGLVKSMNSAMPKNQRIDIDEVGGPVPINLNGA